MKRIIRGIKSVAIGLLKTIFLKISRGSKACIKFPCFVMSGTEITVDKGGVINVGRHLSLRKGCYLIVRNKGKLAIGDNVFMNVGCMITVHEQVSIGNDVELGPGVLIYDHDHDFSAEGGIKSKQFKSSPVKIGNNVWIGANSVILRGTIIGDNCVIGAGAVLKGVYPANSLIVQKRETTTTSISKCGTVGES